MLNLYNVNGLIFWDEHQIRLRNMIVDYVVAGVRHMLLGMNQAFKVVQCEAPLLTPNAFINPNYTNEDVFSVNDLVLRPETTMGSYAFVRHLLDSHTKTKMPLCVWQHGKSFRQEQDQVTKNMRLKEFYQLEFQVIYSKTTANDYTALAIPQVASLLSDLVGPCKTLASDRLPSYSISTTDVVVEQNEMEICSISKRTDFPDAHVLEIAVGTDRMVYNFPSNFWSK